MRALCLFDLDSTLLIETSGLHDTAYLEGIKEVYGVDVALDFNTAGMTDQAIIVKILKKVSMPEEEIQQGLSRCMRAVAGDFIRNIENVKIVVLEGVPKLLTELERHNTLLGLVTGNLESIARAKLRKVNLNHYFTVGGFGEDNINRANLVEMAIARTKGQFAIKPDKIFLFGDTPSDIAAGKEMEVETVGVATGNYSREQLEAAGADFVLPDLRNSKVVLEIILSRR